MSDIEYPTFEERVREARKQLSNALRELDELSAGYYGGDSPTGRQREATRAGHFAVLEARRLLAPATHRCHGDGVSNA